MKVVKDWAGKTVFCIAPGPSLTRQDCELIKQTKAPVVAVNNAWEWAKFCDVIYACDPGWWEHNIFKININAELWTCFENLAHEYELNCHGPFLGALNSGLRALQLAVDRGAKRVILIGYDCSVVNGLHFHGPHEKTPNPDPAKCRKWNTQFSNMDFGDCEIINCSRYTELSCFKKQNLEDVL